jgi:hypothetical protein
LSDRKIGGLKENKKNWIPVRLRRIYKDDPENGIGEKNFRGDDKKVQGNIPWLILIK